METLRQIASSLFLAAFSFALVIGGVSLSLAESYVPDIPTATETQAFFPTPVVNTPTSQALVLVTETQSLSLPSPTILPPTTCPPPNNWIPVSVKPGENLETIAQDYKTTPAQLIAANCLFSQDLSAGSILYVPPQPTKTVVACGPPAGWKQYTVQPGNTMYSLSYAYGISVPQLQRANCIPAYQYNLKTGQVLWLPNITIIRTPIVTATKTLTPISIFFYTPTYTATTLPTGTATATTPPTATTVPPTAPPTATASSTVIPSQTPIP